MVLRKYSKPLLDYDLKSLIRYSIPYFLQSVTEAFREYSWKSNIFCSRNEIIFQSTRCNCVLATTGKQNKYLEVH